MAARDALRSSNRYGRVGGLNLQPSADPQPLPPPRRDFLIFRDSLISLFEPVARVVGRKDALSARGIAARARDRRISAGQSLQIDQCYQIDGAGAEPSIAFVVTRDIFSVRVIKCEFVMASISSSPFSNRRRSSR